MLSHEDFAQVVKNTPLVAFDLIIRSTRGRTLLGLRNNEPARGTWYFPGGRVFKDETLKAAFNRIALAETGREFKTSRFLGVGDFFYPTNFTGQPGFSTHYVSLLYLVTTDEWDMIAFTEPQHSKRQWFSNGQLFDDRLVHPNVQMIMTRLLAKPQSSQRLPVDDPSSGFVEDTGGPS